MLIPVKLIRQEGDGHGFFFYVDVPDDPEVMDAEEVRSRVAECIADLSAVEKENGRSGFKLAEPFHYHPAPKDEP